MGGGVFLAADGFCLANTFEYENWLFRAASFLKIFAQMSVIFFTLV